jgi:hypothetical protein
VNRPEHWLWSHDIKPDQIARLGPAGWTLMSLSSYGDGDRRRFAAVLHKGPSAGRVSLLGLEAWRKREPVPDQNVCVRTHAIAGRAAQRLRGADRQLLAGGRELVPPFPEEETASARCGGG